MTPAPVDRAALVVDVVLAVAFGLVSLLYAVIGDWQDLVVTATFSVALALRRVRTGWSLGLAWAAAALQMATLRDLQPADLAVLGVLYATAAYGSGTVRWLGLGSAGVGAAIATVYLAVAKPLLDDASFPGYDLPSRILWAGVLFVASLALLVLSWTVGLLARTVRDAREQRRRAEVDRRERDLAEYRSVVAEERNRIARDMHDVVAHSLAVIIAQSDGGRFAAAREPAVAVGALETIGGVARGALGDVRVLLAELRHAEGGSPQPVLDDLAGLVDGVRDTGLDVRLHERGARVPLGTGHEIAVYRIAQEGLTNALRHGDTTAPVTVDLAWDAGGVTLRVENRMRPAEVVAQGVRHGIPGMRERAHLTGGTLDIDAADGAFRLTARIPAATVPA